MRWLTHAWACSPGALRYRTKLPLSRRSVCSQRQFWSLNMNLRPTDVKTLSPQDRQRIREISKSIPLVADKVPLDVIFEDDDFLVVNKPDFVKMHPAHRFEGGSLLNRAIGHCGYPPYILHRLDMHTTGVVVFSKKRELCHPISEQFLNGVIKKEYLLIADGCPIAGPGSQFFVEAPIQRHMNIKFAREIGSDRPDSKPARTLYKVLASSTKGMSLMHVFPETGRTHQIRLHALHIGFPIVGDSLYNSKEDLPEERIMILRRRHDLYESIDILNEAAGDPSKVRFADENPLRGGLKLHAWRITLENPNTKMPITFTAPPTSHFAALSRFCGWHI